jgi:hypothetical protein
MCYTVPLAAAITTSFIWKKKKNLKLWYLNLMFSGGSLFGVIDHLWNKELFLISRDWIKDLCLGGVITGGLILAWTVILILAKKSPDLASSLKIEQSRF